MLHVLATNQENILDQLDKFKQLLDHFEELLSAGDYDALRTALDESAQKRRKLTASEEDE